MKIVNVTCERVRTPLAVTNRHPRFSWEIESEEKDIFQSEYRILVKDHTGVLVWDSGKVQSRETVDIAYEGAPLASSGRYVYQITVWDNHRNEAVSGEERFETAAVLTRTEAEAEDIYHIWKSKGVQVSYIDRNSTSFRKGLTVTTFYMAKGLEFEGTKEAFVHAIQTAIPALKQIDIDIKNNEFTALVQMSKDPVPYWLTYDMMSAGFKAMINIAAEIAYRCVELNGFLGVNAVEQTPGIVLIDEVDLYLHPHWQQHVLADLQEAFPLFQFIVTTHSPFIVQSVDTNNVITLDATLSPISPSNRGIEEIMVTEMGLDVDLGNRSEKYRKKYDLAHKYYQLVKEGRGRNQRNRSS